VSSPSIPAPMAIRSIKMDPRASLGAQGHTRCGAGIRDQLVVGEFLIVVHMPPRLRRASWSGLAAVLSTGMTASMAFVFFSAPRLSGTIIRGTLKAPNSQLVTSISIKLQRPDGCD
jgi:hypothetical protein